ncbi:MAG: ATP-binding protein [Candidatus Cohnella colombiensis]|uniref:histidine kinase n=1 Tax=Candidatus Cohnella colombiensis TaxID=3121368 RepID=A0AA95JFR0_9BACL|nr:MAG: ATP-binding protein [Cohnella sp.]
MERALRLITGDSQSTDVDLSIEQWVGLFLIRALEIQNCGAIVLDQQFRVVLVSELLCEIFDVARSEWETGEIEHIFALHSVLPQPFDRSLLEGNVFRNRSWRFMNGLKRYDMLLDGDLIYDRGRLIGACVVFRNITDVLTLQQQVLQSDRLKMIGQIAASTAHEIRNPLTSIKGFMQLLNERLSEREMQHEQGYVTIILSELERINGLVNEFLLLSKPKQMKLVPIRSRHILREILPVIRSEAMLHNVTIKYYPNVALAPIMVDKELIKQVFLNIGKNAIEAMSAGGTLKIREYQQQDDSNNLIVEFIDTGPGIHLDRIEEVFEPFYTTKPEGTGLGLPVCQRIIHEMGGAIKVSSSDQGTTFMLKLPYVHLHNRV